ncbi:CHAT domain-containing tetratricopeptide repeat protein [Dokdonella koreensis]|uniref:CHAT domain containing protein n=1 Tax=Dokdonella koreensis DS-123 TaxID=1300342 RepID=A0A160DY36_9GAMM|nr:CHAT domain-containing protein [Dokdonella koreensis]ANB19678.1 CHAT domain containing protein [Dokdonella koreensis DS-123]
MTVRIDRFVLAQRRLRAAVLGAAWLVATLSAPLSGAGADPASPAQIRALLAAGRDEAALAALTQALAAAPAAPAELQLLLAETHWHRQQPAAAAEAATRALALLGAGDDDAALRQQALRLRGLAAAEQRHTDAALADLREAEGLSRVREGADSAGHAALLGDLAFAQRMAGDYGGAMTSLEAALAIQRPRAASDPMPLALSLLRLGQAQRISGDVVRAEASYREALALAGRAPDPRGRLRADLLYALANLERHRERIEEAIVWYAQAVPAFEQAYGTDSLKLARVLNNYGNAESVRYGRREAAVALYRRALAIALRNPAANPGDYLPLSNIAMVDVWRGRHREAEAGFRAMLGRLEAMPAASEATPLFVQHGLAAALWGQGRHDAAFAAAAAAEHTRQASLRDVAAGLSDQQTLMFQEQEYATLDLAVAIALASGRPALIERAWSLAIAARGQVTAIQAARLSQARTRLASDPAIAPLWQEWLAASSLLEGARLATADDTAAQVRFQRAERRLAQALPKGVAIADVQPGLDAVRAALPPDSALVWMIPVAHRRAEDFASREMHDREREWHALVLEAGSGTPVRVLRLGPARALAAEVAAWQARLATPESDPAQLRAAGVQVASRIWQPIARTTSARRVFVIADAPLQRLAWAALPDGAGHLLDGDRLVHVLNHEEELLASTTPIDAPRYSVLALADPHTGPSGPGTDRRAGCRRPWPPLPGARREAARLQALVAASEAAPMLALVGAAASEAAFRNAAPHAAIVHLATHGTDAAPAPDCRDATGHRGVGFVAEAPPAATTAAALVLAAPAPDSGNPDDGLLGGLEIAALDLHRVRWAVLAACTTAAGPTRHYEGLDGLARAFRIAGAGTVIVSLWPVDDTATAAWSEALYRARFQSQADTTQAMRSAQRQVLATRKAAGLSTHPFYWAGFLALGDWR